MDTNTLKNARAAVTNLLNATAWARMDLKSHGLMAESATKLHELITECENLLPSAEEEKKP